MALQPSSSAMGMTATDMFTCQQAARLAKMPNRVMMSSTAVPRESRMFRAEPGLPLMQTNRARAAAALPCSAEPGCSSPTALTLFTNGLQRTWQGSLHRDMHCRIIRVAEQASAQPKRWQFYYQAGSPLIYK